ncbi:DNA repair protein endonuclease SAE2/CtIP C-terminus-domain-containing protein [Yarrowia lipolytica]|nr:DNA repair protein endonuclease SAE2/CtIP C-terminus-domain-containing protein [Yarrowia lipolytica]RDW43066.1 DNA repair protein endonuclease SAE2/CtIP C-terminus-domain-containing protein [Yarrowia lipolytica]RDW49793.1 DNA repair protein endonuclease SAE2/CtIP C-terminus-domain-containing protein [Yarrowia lipolytica]
MEKAKKSVEILETELAVLKEALDSVQNSPTASSVKQEFPQTPNTLPRSDLQEQYDKLALSHAKLIKLRKGDIKSVNLWKEALQDHKGRLKESQGQVLELKKENQILKDEIQELKKIKQEQETVAIQTSQTCPDSDEITTEQIRAEAGEPVEITNELLRSSPPFGKKGLLIKDSIDLDAVEHSSPSVSREIDPDLENDTRRHQGVVFKQPKPTNLMQWLKVKEENIDQDTTKSNKRDVEVVDLDSQGSPKEKTKKSRKSCPAQYQLTDFVINPAFNGDLDFAYAETVRGSRRQCEHGGECRQCDEFYKMAGPGIVSAAPQWSATEDKERGRKMDIEETINASSRHRNRWKRAPSPPGFWRSDFPSTQEIVEEKKLAEENRRKEIEIRYKSAVSGGKWMFRDQGKHRKE